MARWLVYLAILGAVALTVGRPWTWVWIAGLPLIGATFHVAWRVKHQINPLTAAGSVLPTAWLAVADPRRR